MAEGFHRGGNELARALAERLVDDDGRIPGHIHAGPGELVAQSCGEAERRQAFVLTTRQGAARFVRVHNFAGLVDLFSVEVDVAADIEDRPGGEVFACAGLRDDVHEVLEREETLFRLVSVEREVVFET